MSKKDPKIYNETEAKRKEENKLLHPEENLFRLKVSDNEGNVDTLGIWKSKPCASDIKEVAAEVYHWELSDSELFTLRCMDSVVVLNWAIELEEVVEGQVLNF